MLYLTLGFVLLLAGLIVARLITGSSPASRAVGLQRARVFAGSLLVIVAAILTARNLLPLALPALMLGLWLISSASGSIGSPVGGPAGARATSRVTTDYLDIELDHETGAIAGRVLKGLFAGRRLETLATAELALLWQDARHEDPASARVIEAYLDRIHPDWREEVARGEHEMNGPDGRMSREEAYEILGLDERATAADVRRAHRELIVKLHPDRGGSTYLAAKVNEAKDVLLAVLKE
ncbi:MAG: DnaJ domain-containing protein [Hyphomicrobiaceae bacterium]|nr:DnaJ domain-containing protein [Hyphomicrobiaceae bacterium]